MGRPEFYTSEGAGGRVLNQVWNVYNSFGQLAVQYQEHDRAATTSSYKVQYFYDNSNPSRLTHMAYPDGRTLWYGYSGIDANIGRVSWIADGTTTQPNTQPLEKYSYLGLGQVVGKTRPGPNTSESIHLDAYGRISSLTWSAGSTATDAFNYGYDNDGNVMYRANVVATAAGHPELGESYTYNNLNLETTFKRGTLTNNVADGSQVNATWTVDSQGNRYGGKYAASYNAANESADAIYSNAGYPKTVNLSTTNSAGLRYDAWGRLVQTWGDTPITYAYDATGRLISATYTSLSGSPGVQEFYDGQDLIEERDLSGTLTAQYVWSGAGPAEIVLRDQKIAADNATVGTLYAQQDAAGNTTSLTNASGVVVERYTYDQDGQPTALDPTLWTPWGSPQPAGISHQTWSFLYHGMRWWQLFYNGNNRSLGTRGMYQVDAQWYDPTHGRLIQPLDATNYDQSLGLSVGGLITAIRVGSWIYPPVGFTINLAANIMDRLAPLNGDAGQPWDQALAGGVFDTIGLTDLIGGFKNHDYIADKDLHWSTGERWFHGIAGALQFAPYLGMMAKSVLPVVGGGMGRLGNAVFNSSTSGSGALSVGISGAFGLRLATAGQFVGAAGGYIGSLSGIPKGLGSIGNSAYALQKNSARDAMAEELAEGGLTEGNDFRSGVKSEAELHHIATNKDASYTPLFQKIFQDAGMTLDDPLNKISVIGHQGPHGEAYNWIILNELQLSVQNLVPKTPQFQAAIQSKLSELASEILTHGSTLNEMVRFPG